MIDRWTHLDCVGLYSGPNQGYITFPEAEEACRKDDLCAGIWGARVSEPDDDDDEDECYIDVFNYFLCKSLVEITDPKPVRECLWKKYLGGLYDNGYQEYGNILSAE